MKALLRVALVLFVVGCLAAGTAFYLGRRFVLETTYGDYSGGEKTVVIEPGTSAIAILRQLESAGVIARADAARIYLVLGLDSPPLQAGEYRFDEPVTTRDALDKLIAGEVVTYPVTLIEGLTLDETAVALADAGFGDLEVLRREMASPERIHDLDPAAENLEGYLFPDTYRFARGADEAEIVSTLVNTFRRLATGELGAGFAADPALLRERVVLASIVEKEAQLDTERPTIAGVYRNRLDRGIALYADPTVIYALKLAGTWDGDIRRRDLDIDSPYNTYRNAGLPPGPICSPGLASLQAATNPADVPYIYFVSRNDGSHVFARTLAEHNRNVYQWQKLYWRQKRAAAKAAEGDGDRVH